MVYLLGTFDFGWIVGIVLVDGEVEHETPALVHALIRLDGKLKVENVVWIRECGLHGGPQRYLAQILNGVSSVMDWLEMVASDLFGPVTALL